MKQSCSKGGCPAPNGLCVNLLSEDYHECEYFSGSTGTKNKTNESAIDSEVDFISLPWKGQALQPKQLGLISARSTPRIIGLIGTQDAGKTSYLGMLYTLLSNGNKFMAWNFAGSQTLLGWESQASYIKIRSDGTIESTPATPADPEYYSLYHLALKQGNSSLMDVLWADSSGEAFKKWSERPEDPEAENAAWIYTHSDGFIFFVDCVRLIEKRGAAYREIVQIAEQVSQNLAGRPISIVWSKSDRLQEVRPKIRNKLELSLKSLFPNGKVLEISNFPGKNPDPFCHVNNLASTEYLLESFVSLSQSTLNPPISSSGNDFFLNYGRGHEQ